MARLEELLEDDDALVYYLEVTQQEAHLPELIHQELAEKSTTHRRRRHIPWKPVSLAAAACLIFSLGLYIGRQAPTTTTHASTFSTSPTSPDLVTPSLDTPPAHITGLVGVEWEEGKEPNQLHHGKAAGHIAFKTGLVELTYANGVKLTLEGPADYQINDTVSGRLNKGKLYATVPQGAEGFRVDYSQGSVTDLGTEFAMDARQDGSTEVGVFKGEVELNRPGAKPLSIFENHSLIHVHHSDQPIQTVALDREKFVRDLPTRDFRWELNSFHPKEIVIDVTHLVWKPSKYRAIFKWVTGKDGIQIRNVQLCLDGQPVTTDPHLGSTGWLPQVHDNIYELNIDPKQFRRGTWTVRATIELLERKNNMASYHGIARSQGILQFEEGLVSTATAEDFIGRWSYRAFNSRFVREFHPDGTITLEKNGKINPQSFRNGRWTVENGVLHATVPKHGTVESHVLRNPNTLIFIGQPFENAKKITPTP
jgi:hypothetical protein